jgi:hypothetical protein
MANRKQTQRKHWSEKHARQLLAEQAASGETMTAFARGRGLWPQRLWRWKKVLAVAEGEPLGPQRGSPAPAFVPVVLTAASPELAAEVELGGGVRVKLCRLEPAAAHWVALLYQALGGAP